MSKVLQIVGAVLLFAVAAFCVFGFLAAAEAAPVAAEVWSVRLMYGLVGLGAVGGAGWLAWPRRSTLNKSQ
jgi:hypothetical protein